LKGQAQDSIRVLKVNFVRDSFSRFKPSLRQAIRCKEVEEEVSRRGKTGSGPRDHPWRRSFDKEKDQGGDIPNWEL
jgi:hypothetical protein